MILLLIGIIKKYLIRIDIHYIYISKIGRLLSNFLIGRSEANCNSEPVIRIGF